MVEQNHVAANVSDAESKNEPLRLENEIVELARVDDCLAAMQKAHASDNHKYVRKLKIAEGKIQKKDEDISSLKGEIEKLRNEFANAKADLLGDLLVAERKVKQLETELNDAKTFITRHVLPANDTVSKLIRSRYGDGNEMKTLNARPAIRNAPEKCGIPSELSNAIEGISASSTILMVPVGDPEPAAPETALPADAPTESEEVAKPVEDDDDVVQDEVEVESENDQMEIDENAIHFPCDHCSKSFSTMALKFRHEKKSHANAHDTDQEEENDAEYLPKPLKKIGAAKKMVGKKRTQKERKLLKDYINAYGMARAMKTQFSKQQLRRYI